MMANIFYIEKGFSVAEIATYSKFFGTVATIIGGVLVMTNNFDDPQYWALTDGKPLSSQLMQDLTNWPSLTLLDGAINDAVTTITVDSTADFPSAGQITIGSEEITYTGVTTTTFTGCVRGANGTTAATHTSGDAVNQFVSGMDDILEASYRNASNVDAPLTKRSRSQYQALANKTDTGTPTQYFVERFIDRVTMTLFLTPGASVAGHHINFYYQKRIQDVGDAYTNAADVPYRFAPCMTAGLAFYLSQKYAPQRTQELKLYYEDELKRALAEDGSSSSTFISPKTYYPGV